MDDNEERLQFTTRKCKTGTNPVQLTTKPIPKHEEATKVQRKGIKQELGFTNGRPCSTTRKQSKETAPMKPENQCRHLLRYPKRYNLFPSGVPIFNWASRPCVKTVKDDSPTNMPKLRLDDDSYLFFSQLEALPESTDLTKCHHCDAPNLEPMPAINLIRALHGIYMIKELTVLRLLTLFSGYTLETLEVCRWLNGLRTFYDEDYTVKFGGLLCNAWCDHWSSTFTNSINISAAAAVLRWSNTYILPENKPPSMSKSMELQQSHEDGIVLRDADVPLNERSIAYQTSTTNLLEYSVYSKTTDCWSKLPKYDGCLARNGEHCGFHSVEY